MVQNSYKIGLIGAGHMGKALLAGWLASRTAVPGEITACDTNRSGLKATVKKFGIEAAKSNRELVASSETVVLAVKPQVMDGVLDDIAKVTAGKTLYISIAAGYTLARMEGRLGTEIGAVRVMPNTPALIGEGISALSFNRQVSGEEKERAMGLMGAVGETVEVDERIMDAVTGLSGSGPAYVYVLIEALSDAGVRQGIPRDVARQLAAHTVRGASGMVLKSGCHPGELKDMVTSPGGTTIAGLHALEQGGFRAILYDAVAAATARSQDLGRGE